MPWLQLHLTVEREQAAAAEQLLEGLGACSVTMSDGEDHPLFEPDPGEVRLWPHTQVSGLFSDDHPPERLQQQALQALAGVVSSVHLERLEDQQWERVWLAHFHPMRFGQRLWICPSGSRIEAADAVVVDLDPGLAFGTGTHPTTALCLEWLDHHPQQGQRVIDFGCGSGILAIAACKLGASQVIAIDHDPQALAATRDNGARNRVSERLWITTSDCLPVEPVALLIANILSEVLIEWAERLTAQVASGGSILLSGILEAQWPTVAAAYRPHFTLEPPRIKEGWVLLTGVRR